MQGERQEQALVTRLRTVVKQLSRIRGDARRVASTAPKATRPGQPWHGTGLAHQERDQAAWGEYEWGQYASAHKASPDIVAPKQQPPPASAGAHMDDYTLSNIASMQKVAPADMRRPRAEAAARGQGQGKGQGRVRQPNRHVSVATVEQAYRQARRLAESRRRRDTPRGAVAASGTGQTEGGYTAGRSGLEVVRSEGRGKQASGTRRKRKIQRRRGRVGALRGEVKRRRSQLDASGEVCKVKRTGKRQCDGVGAGLLPVFGDDAFFFSRGAQARGIPAMYPAGYHIGSTYQKSVKGYSRRMMTMALNFCHGQVRA